MLSGEVNVGFLTAHRIMRLEPTPPVWEAKLSSKASRIRQHRAAPAAVYSISRKLELDSVHCGVGTGLGLTTFSPSSARQ